MTDFQPIPLPDFVEFQPAEMMRRAERFLAEMRRRHSCREFSNRPVPRELVETALKVAGTAPSGANLQPWHFVAISDPARKAIIRKEAEIEERAFYKGKAGEEWLKALKPLGTDPNKDFLEIAPWLIAVFGARKSQGPDGVWHKNYYVPESVSIATGFLIAALHHSGLATLTHTPSPMGFLNEICKRPEEEKPYMLIVTGYPAKNATIPKFATVKKTLGEIATILE